MERRQSNRGRTLLSGSLIFNANRSTIGCVVRNLSEGGCCVEVASALGFPDEVELLIAGESLTRSAHVVWRSAKRAGLRFVAKRTDSKEPPVAASGAPAELLLSFESALEEVDYGVLLVDADLTTQFMNRAFRTMWRVPDELARTHPRLEALIRHGHRSRAPDWSHPELEEYVANRLALVKAGSKDPIDIPLSNGQVVRLSCAVLPNGGRMLTYNYVTDFIKRSDELNALRAALHHVPEGIVLLDADMRVQFMNRAVRRLWQVSDEEAESKPLYAELVRNAKYTGAYGVAPGDLDGFISRRIEMVQSADPTPQQLRTSDGREIHSQCAILPNGGRMLTYWDVSEFVRNAERLQHLASVDPLTGLFNRRHFFSLAQTEWERFQRYNRPLSMLFMDIDVFKDINDRFGHAVGDEVLVRVGEVCRESLRSMDIAGRLGGDEFAVMLPETDPDRAATVAERIRAGLAKTRLSGAGNPSASVSIGISSATLSMSGPEALLRAADAAMYRAKLSGRNRIAIGTADHNGVMPLAAE